MSKDISHLLSEWEYDPEETIRLVAANDGRQVMQVRLPLGIEQYELDGRPDGSRPFGRTSVLDEIDHRLGAYKAERSTDEGFRLDHDDFVLLQKEGVLYYYRYLLLFQVGDYERTALDTGHNLRLCTLVEKYCDEADDRKTLLQYKPYILRMNALSRSMISLSADRKAEALEIVEEAIRGIEAIEDVDTPVFQWERHRSLSHLRDTLKRLKEHKITKDEQLEDELMRAVEDENYERAAELRDEIAILRRGEPG